MENKLEIFAIYKLDNELKVLTTDGKNIFEIIVRKENKKDIVIVNSDILTEERAMTPEELDANIYLARSIIANYLGTNEKSLSLKISSVSKGNEYILETFANQGNKTWGYENLSISPTVKEDIMGKYIRLLSTRQNFSADPNEFIHEYETDSLRSLRFYRKQRTDYIPWDEYFMAVAKLTSLRSKDPNTQVGACIVASDNRILSVGYNGAPLGIEDDVFPWDRSGVDLHTKYMYVCHAELNAILNYRGSRKDFEGATIYVDLFPCNECAKTIIQAGIKHVVYLSDKYANTDGTIASKRLFDLAGVTYTPLNPDYHDTITLSLNPNNK